MRNPTLPVKYFRRKFFKRMEYDETQILKLTSKLFLRTNYHNKYSYNINLIKYNIKIFAYYLFQNRSFFSFRVSLYIYFPFLKYYIDSPLLSIYQLHHIDYK